MSWDELASIEADRRAEVDRETTERPVACPNDGEPLQHDPVLGGFRCKFDGWHWPTNARVL